MSDIIRIAPAPAGMSVPQAATAAASAPSAHIPTPITDLLDLHERGPARDAFKGTLNRINTHRIIPHTVWSDLDNTLRYRNMGGRTVIRGSVVGMLNAFKACGARIGIFSMNDEALITDFIADHVILQWLTDADDKGAYLIRGHQYLYCDAARFAKPFTHIAHDDACLSGGLAFAVPGLREPKRFFFPKIVESGAMLIDDTDYRTEYDMLGNLARQTLDRDSWEQSPLARALEHSRPLLLHLSRRAPFLGAAELAGLGHVLETLARSAAGGA